jgi:hypothetical protein
VEEDAEAMATEDGLESHPLLARPSAIATVAPALPTRVFLPTEVGVLLSRGHGTIVLFSDTME